MKLISIGLALATIFAIFACKAGGKDVYIDSAPVWFGSLKGLNQWSIVNDVVMGGRSESELTISDNGNLLFQGRMSLANNGGFASVRTQVSAPDLGAYEGLEIRVRGDGRQYRLRLRTDRDFDGVAYQHSFDTEQGGWTTIRMPFSVFQAGFRGRALREAPALDPDAVVQLGFMIADKQAGPFRLAIDWVRPYRWATELSRV